MWIRGVRWSAVSVIGVVVLLSSQQQHRLSDTFTGWNDAVLRVENRTHSHKNNTNRTNESTAIGIIPTTTVAEDDLFDWERESIDAIKSVRSTKRDADRGCNPPKGVSIKCCIGWSNQESFACRGKRWQDYQRVQKIARRHTVPLVHSKEEQEAHDGQCRDDACHIVRLLIQHNLTLSFIGDSIAHQMVEGFICALQRRGWEANVSKLPHDNVSLNIEVENRVNVTFFHHLAFPDPANLFDEVLATTDVLVVNYGLHWAIDARRPRWQPDVYRSQWNNTLSRWGQVSKLPKLLVYRESSAQHFDADGGEYFIRNEETAECVPLQQQQQEERTSQHFGWRERTVTELARENGFRVVTADASLASQPPIADDKKRKELVVLPFLTYTAELHHMHQLGGGDCTHYCSSPFLWQPAWRSLRIAMDRRFSSTA